MLSGRFGAAEAAAQLTEQRLNRLSSAVLAGLMACGALALGGCQKAAPAGPEAKYAGLEEAILGWRNDLEKSPTECPKGPDGKSCQSFDVGCKGERPPGAGETAKLVVAMSWDAWNPKQGEYGPASGLAEFSKAGGKWHRKDLPGPVNLNTCATTADAAKPAR
jgi:hypothetical protein